MLQKNTLFHCIIRYLHVYVLYSEFNETFIIIYKNLYVISTESVECAVPK